MAVSGGPVSAGPVSGKLETDVAEIKAILQRLAPLIERIDREIAELKGRVSQMPTWWQLLIGVVAIMSATVAILKFAV